MTFLSDGHDWMKQEELTRRQSKRRRLASPSDRKGIRRSPIQSESESDAAPTGKTVSGFSRATSTEKDKKASAAHHVGAIVFGDMVSIPHDPSSATTCTSHPAVSIKPRPFIVFQKTHRHSICIPIFTYGGRGARSKLNAAEHVSVFDCRAPLKDTDVAEQQSAWAPLMAQSMKTGARRLHGRSAAYFCHPVNRDHSLGDRCLGRISSSSLARLRNLILYSLAQPNVEADLLARIESYRRPLGGVLSESTKNGRENSLNEQKELSESLLGTEGKGTIAVKLRKTRGLCPVAGPGSSVREGKTVRNSLDLAHGKPASKSGGTLTSKLQLSSNKPPRTIVLCPKPSSIKKRTPKLKPNTLNYPASNPKASTRPTPFLTPSTTPPTSNPRPGKPNSKPPRKPTSKKSIHESQPGSRKRPRIRCDVEEDEDSAYEDGADWKGEGGVRRSERLKRVRTL